MFIGFRVNMVHEHAFEQEVFVYRQIIRALLGVVICRCMVHVCVKTRWPPGFQQGLDTVRISALAQRSTQHLLQLAVLQLKTPPTTTLIS